MKWQPSTPGGGCRYSNPPCVLSIHVRRSHRTDRSPKRSHENRPLTLPVRKDVSIQNIQPASNTSASAQGGLGTLSVGLARGQIGLASGLGTPDSSALKGGQQSISTTGTVPTNKGDSGVAYNRQSLNHCEDCNGYVQPTLALNGLGLPHYCNASPRPSLD